MHTNFVSTFNVHKYYKPKKAFLALTILTLMLLITTIFTTTPIMAQSIPNNTSIEIPQTPIIPSFEELNAQAIAVGDEGGLKNAIIAAENGKNTIIALTQDIQLSTTLSIPQNKNITLMSNNQDIFYKLINVDNTVTIFVDDEGFLIIYSIIVTHVEDAMGSGVQVNKEGTLIMMGGEISSNTATNGGGIYNMGTFIMCDGSISNNIAIRDGAGIYNLDSTFEMFNGKILDNKAITGDRVTSCGGGVYSENSIFNMYDGEISRNSADDGGGVYSAGANAKFAMYGGIIGGSAADKNMARSDGGGVYNSLGIFEMYDGEISYNEANTVPLNSGGGGVYTFGTFEMFGGIISNNKVFSLNNSSGGFSGGGVHARGIFNMWGGEISGNDGHMRGGGVSLSGDICDSFFTMYDGKISGNTAGFGGGVHVNINTNTKKGGFTMLGGEISGNIANNNIVNTDKGTRNPGYGGGVCGEVGDVILEGGKISGNTALYGGGVFNYAYGTFIMNDGIIGGNTPEEANTASIRGGGVYNLQGNLFMYGGKISGNTAPAGGGVGNDAKVFTMLGGEISNNKATNGGGVYNIGSAAIFKVSGGEISNNFATYGGGIYNSDLGGPGTITINGGKISENVATNSGGGIYASYSNLNKITVEAGVVFSYNHAASLHDRNPSDNDLYKAQIADEVTWTIPAIQGYNNYDISYTRGPAITLYTVTVHDSYASASGTGSYAVGAQVTVDAGTREGYTFTGWTINQGNINLPNNAQTTFTMPNNNIIITAQWTQTYNIQYNLNGGVNAQNNPTTYTTIDLPLNIDNPTKTDYTFLGWTVKYANGSSITVPPILSYTIPEGTTGDIVLTALWVAIDVEDTIKYTITYHGNGHTAGIAPIDVNSPYVSGSVVIVLGQGTLVKEGYKFSGWATNSHNTNTVTHIPGSTFTILKDTQLYAVWEEIPQQQYTVIYRPGVHGTFVEQVVWGLLLGEPTPQPPQVTGEVGWKFTGWSPVPTELVEGDAVYVAQWEQEMFTVVFKDWDGIILKTQQVAYGGSATAPANPSRSGYTFTGWDHPFTNVVSDIIVTAQYTSAGGGGNSGGGSSSGSSTQKPPTTTTITPPITTPPSTTLPPVATPTTEEEVVAVWALVNLVLSVVGVILAIILTICVLLQRKQKQEEQEENAQRGGKGKMTTNNINKEEEEDEVKRQRQRRLFWFATAVIMGIAGIIVFMLTEDMSLPRVMVDKWTIVNAIIFIVEIIAIALTFKRNKNNNNNDKEDNNYLNETPENPNYTPPQP